MSNDDKILDKEDYLEDYFISDYDKIIGILFIGFSIILFFKSYSDYSEFTKILEPFSSNLNDDFPLFFNSSTFDQHPRWDEITIYFISGIFFLINGIGIYLKNKTANHFLLTTMSFLVSYSIFRTIYDYHIWSSFVYSPDNIIPYLFITIMIFGIILFKKLFFHNKKLNFTFIFLGIILGSIPYIYERYFIINEIFIGGPAIN